MLENTAKTNESNKMADANHLQNLHTHTTYCDGINTPEQVILTAIDKGFGAIGFSGHSYMYYSEEHSMSLEGTEKYKAEISLLKQKYSDQIDVFCGFIDCSELLKACGFREKFILTESGFVSVPL